MAFDAKPPEFTNNPRPSFTFPVRSRAHVQLQLDDGPAVGLRVALRAPTLLDGSHTVRVPASTTPIAA